MKKKLLWAVSILVAIFLGMQVVPVNRDNPPVTGEIDAPAEVMAVLRESCYDCHSNETTWPWYSYVAPISWEVAEHVEEGRDELNFSTWQDLEPARQQRKIRHIWEEVDEAKMPLEDYLRFHADARLTPEDVATLKAWTEASAAAASDTAAPAAPTAVDDHDHSAH